MRALCCPIHLVPWELIDAWQGEIPAIAAGSRPMGGVPVPVALVYLLIGRLAPLIVSLSLRAREDGAFIPDLPILGHITRAYHRPCLLQTVIARARDGRATFQQTSLSVIADLHIE